MARFSEETEMRGLRARRKVWTYFELGRRVLRVGEREFHGQSDTSNCCLNNCFGHLRPRPLSVLQRKGRSPGCLNGLGFGWGRRVALFSPRLQWPCHYGSVGRFRKVELGYQAGAPSPRRLAHSPSGADPGLAPPACCEARTSGIPREDSEVQSRLGFLAQSCWTGKAWARLLPAGKWCEVSSLVFFVCKKQPIFPSFYCGSLVFQESSPGLEPRGKGMFFVSRRWSCL